MSAIFGRVERSDRPIDAERFEACASLLKFYGADHTALQIQGHCAVAEFGLAIAPRPPPRPLGAQGDQLSLVADAVLDARDDIIAALNLASGEAAVMSDRDLIHAAYARWGEACVDRLTGDFAFAAIDIKSRRLVLARDHIGARPLYYAIRGSTALFSTSLEALVRCPEFDWPIRETAIVCYLSDPASPRRETFYEHIESVPPGGCVTIDAAGVQVRRWWNPSLRTSLRFKNAGDYVDASRAIVKRAVADRIEAAGAVAAHCSGGLDSTGVTVLANRILKTAGSALSAAYLWAPPLSSGYPDMGPHDERRKIGALAEREKFAVRNGGGGGSNFLAFLERPMELEGQADLADELPILQHAAQDNIRILLSGWGADEVFSAHGKGYLAHLVMSGRLQRARRFAASQTRTLRNFTILSNLAWDQIIYPLLPCPLHTALSPFRNYYPNKCFLAPELARRHRALVAEQRAPLRFTADPKANMKRHFQAGHITMRMESWAAWSAPHGFQYRYPLTDRRLIEFMLSIPPEAVFLNDRPRGLALATFADVFTDYAGKDDPANQKLRADAMTFAWRGLAQQVLDGRFDRDCPWLDMAAFRRAASAPAPITDTNSIMTFAELFSATRVYRIFERRGGV